jgi:flagellar hook-associated protein 3 FlgL
MRITNNMVTNSVLAELQQLDTQQSSLQAEVSSGLAVTQPSDDPAVFGQVIQEESQSNQLAQFNANGTQAINVANSSYAGLNSLTQVYDRATELATEGTGTLGASADAGYADEMTQLIQQAVTVANSQSNGNYLFAGTAVSAKPFTTTLDSNGTITAVNYVGNYQQTAIPLSATSSVTPSTSGTTNSGMATMINNMIAVRDALTAGDAAALATAATALNTSEDVLSSAVADNGAVQLGIQSQQTQQQSNAAEVSNLISTQADANLPTVITKLDQAQLAYQAAMETAAKVMQLSLINYIH